VRGPLTFTPPLRLLRLEAIVPGLKNGVEVCLADMSWGGWVLLIVLHDEVWCFDIRDHLPRVVFSAEAVRGTLSEAPSHTAI